MIRSTRFTAAAIAAVLLLLGLSWYLRSWGGVALVAVGVALFVWYRNQVARAEEDAQQFFGDMGEETRLTSLQASPSELPLDAPLPRPPTPPPPPIAS